MSLNYHYFSRVTILISEFSPHSIIEK